MVGHVKMREKDEKSLPLEERLKIIDDEIRKFHKSSLAKGYTPSEIEKSAEPLLGHMRRAHRKRWLMFFCKVALCVALLAALWRYDPTYRMICSYTRLAAIQVLPYWDWTAYYGRDCLVENPYFVGSKLLEEDCELCENLEAIDREMNMSHALMLEDYLKRDIPVIITDSMEEWDAMQRFNIPFLNTLYSTDETLKDILPCMFASNVRVKYGNPRTLLARASRGDITNWYAHWENCEKSAAKILRQFYKRPYFLPPSVEMAQSNWLFLASHYKGKKNKPADIAFPMMWMAQIKGQMKVTLTPRPPCNSTCPTLYNTLHEGDVLVVTDMMWLLDYMPVSAGDTIAIGSGGFFD